MLWCAAALISGCTSTRITHTEPTSMMVGTNLVRSGGGFTISRTTGLTKHSVADLAVETSGGINFRMKGYQNDQVQALGVAVDAAVSAAIKSTKP